MAEALQQIASRVGTRGAAHAWVLVALLFLFMLTNFADRAVLGLAAVPIMRELGLTHAQFGLIATSFFTLFSVGGVIGGFLVNRIATRWVLAALALIWSLCQLPMLLSASVAALVANRIALGFGEGPAYPVALHATYKWFPKERRAVPTSLIAVGALAGNGIAAPAIVAVIAAWSWQAAFGALGVASLIWCVVWLTFAHEGPLTADGPSSCRHAVTIPYGRMLRSRTVIGVQVVGFCANWLLTLAAVWLPAFLAQAFGYTLLQAAWIMMLVSLGQMVLLPAVSILSDGLRRNGVSSRLATGSIACASTIAAGLIIMVMARSEGSLPIIVCTVVAFSLCSVTSVLGPVLIAEIAPVAQRGAILGVTNAITTLAGPLAPSVTGLVIDVAAHPADGIRTALVLAGALAISGAVAGLLLIDPEADLARHSAEVADRVEPAQQPT